MLPVKEKQNHSTNEISIEHSIFKSLQNEVSTKSNHQYGSLLFKQNFPKTLLPIMHTSRMQIAMSHFFLFKGN